MQAVILAAGRGVRMGELTNDKPKPLLEIAGRPILEYTLENLPEEVSEVILVIGYKGEMIKEYFGDNWQGKKISYVEQKQMDGTGGAILAAKDLLSDKFLVLMADDLYHRSDLAKLLPYDLALLVREIEQNTRFGVVEKDEKENLKSIIEFKDLQGKQINEHLVNMGAYMLNKEFFNYPLVKISEKEYGLPQSLAQMTDKYKIKVIKADCWHPNGHQEDLIKGEAVVKKHFNIN